MKAAELNKVDRNFDAKNDRTVKFLDYIDVTGCVQENLSGCPKHPVKKTKNPSITV